MQIIAGWIGIDPMDESNQIRCRVFVTTSNHSQEVGRQVRHLAAQRARGWKTGTPSRSQNKGIERPCTKSWFGGVDVVEATANRLIPSARGDDDSVQLEILSL